MMATKIVMVMVVPATVPHLHVEVEAMITCNQVVNNLVPCLRYLKSGVGPDPRCCNGAKALNALAKTTLDRQTACGCLKTAASSYGVGPKYSVSLPGKCGVNLRYKFTPSIDCAKVK